MPIYERPNEIIAYCLKHLELDPASEAYKEVVLRLQHVIKTFQLAAAKPKPVPVDFSQIRTIVINESAHGDD